jgi:RHS repeat-associated protein
MNQYTAMNGATSLYDQNFNLYTLNGWRYDYDADKQLLLTTNGANLGQFVYDGLGRCVKRTINGVVTVITYDEWKPIMEWDGSGNLSAVNVYGPGADEILYRYVAATNSRYRYHHDIHGNVTFLLDWSGTQIVERYTYDAFGKPEIKDGTGNVVEYADHTPKSAVGNRFMFQGREYLQELGIYDYRHRFYHPALGRFLQSDPTGFDAGDMNLFRYCGDDPVDRSDPMGLESDGYLHLSPVELTLLQQARANVERPGHQPVEIWQNHWVTKPVTKMQAVIARGNQRKLSDAVEGGYELRIVGNTKTWVQLEKLKIPGGWRAVVATHKYWNGTGFGSATWSGDDRTTARSGTMVERTDETQPGEFKRLVPRTDRSGRYKAEDFNHPIRERDISGKSGGGGGDGSSGGSGTSSGPTAAQVDAAHQATGVPSLGVESVNRWNGRL